MKASSILLSALLCLNGVIVQTTQASEPINCKLQQTRLACPGESNGRAIATVSGGDVDEVYAYSWKGGEKQGGNEIELSGLAKGSCVLTVVQGNSKTTCSVSIAESEPIVVFFRTYAENGGEDINAVEVMAQGGTKPYKYVWSGPDGFTSIGTIVTKVSGGPYFVEITDANGCKGAGGPLDVGKP